MHIDRTSGLLDEATYIPSPNFEARPESHHLSLIVVHNISLPPGKFGGEGVTQLFTNQLDPNEHPYYKEIHQLRVSSHLYIRRHGEIIQYVPFHFRAWHAGQSSYAGQHACNDYSVGIELEGTDDIAYEDIQYERLNTVIDALCLTYPGLSRQHIAGHCEIAPGRKTDPGPVFDWNRVRQEVG